MNKPQYKTQIISDKRFKMLLYQVCHRYNRALKALAGENYRIASGKETEHVFSKLEKRHKRLYDDLAKT